MEMDRQGRYKYDPEFFGRTGKAYDQEEIDYIINWYDKIDMNEMGFALERTPNSIQTFVGTLRKEGKMPKGKRGRRKKLE